MYGWRRSIGKRIYRSKSKTNEKSNEYNIAKNLMKRLDTDNAEKILSDANEYCDNECTKPSYLNPILTCVPMCEIWKVKNKALRVKKKSV